MGPNARDRATDAAELDELGEPVAGEYSDWRGLRIRRGVSIRELEARTGINRGVLSMIETGRMVARPWECARMLAALRPMHPAADAKAIGQLTELELRYAHGDR